MRRLAVPGLPLLHSTDLVNWELIGHALPRLTPDALFSTPQHGKRPWASALRHHDGRFCIYSPEPDLGIFVVTADQPAGPWSDPVLYSLLTHRQYLLLLIDYGRGSSLLSSRSLSQRRTDC